MKDMKLNITSCMNGYIVFVPVGFDISHDYPSGQTWIAKDDADLGKLLEKLGKEFRLGQKAPGKK